MGAAGAAAGGSAILGLMGAAVQVQANNKALRGQSKASRLQLDQLRASETEQMRQLQEQSDTAKGYLTADTAGAEQEIQRGLEAENLDIAKRVSDVRRELMGILGEQTATLAARGIGGGSAADNLAREATGYADEDERTLAVNRATAAADAATAKSGVRTGAARQRAAIDTELRNARRVSEMTVRNAYAGAEVELDNASDQTGLANLAAVLNGASGAANSGLSYWYQSRAGQSYTGPTTASQRNRPLIYSSRPGAGV